MQLEYPWVLGPHDGRYIVRPAGQPGGEVSSVLVLGTLGAARRPTRARRADRHRPADPEPAPVATTRATVVFVDAPLEDAAAGGRWLRLAAEPHVERALRTINAAIRAHRLALGDPSVNEVTRAQALIVRAGHGRGEQVADGDWEEAVVMPAPAQRKGRRIELLRPQERVAAMLGARESALACEELALRARLDLDGGRDREAALQLRIALEAAVAELEHDERGDMAERVGELAGLQAGVAAGAARALHGELDEAELALVERALGRLEAALRARSVAGTS